MRPIAKKKAASGVSPFATYDVAHDDSAAARIHALKARRHIDPAVGMAPADSGYVAAAAAARAGGACEIDGPGAGAPSRGDGASYPPTPRSASADGARQNSASRGRQDRPSDGQDQNYERRGHSHGGGPISSGLYGAGLVSSSPGGGAARAPAARHKNYASSANPISYIPLGSATGSRTVSRSGSADSRQHAAQQQHQDHGTHRRSDESSQQEQQRSESSRTTVKHGSQQRSASAAVGRDTSRRGYGMSVGVGAALLSYPGSNGGYSSARYRGAPAVTPNANRTTHGGDDEDVQENARVHVDGQSREGQGAAAAVSQNVSAVSGHHITSAGSRQTQVEDDGIEPDPTVGVVLQRHGRFEKPTPQDAGAVGSTKVLAAPLAVPSRMMNTPRSQLGFVLGAGGGGRSTSYVSKPSSVPHERQVDSAPHDNENAESRHRDDDRDDIQHRRQEQSANKNADDRTVQTVAKNGTGGEEEEHAAVKQVDARPPSATASSAAAYHPPTVRGYGVHHKEATTAISGRKAARAPFATSSMLDPFKAPFNVAPSNRPSSADRPSDRPPSDGRSNEVHQGDDGLDVDSAPAPVTAPATGQSTARSTVPPRGQALPPPGAVSLSNAAQRSHSADSARNSARNSNAGSTNAYRPIGAVPGTFGPPEGEALVTSRRTGGGGVALRRHTDDSDDDAHPERSREEVSSSHERGAQQQQQQPAATVGASNVFGSYGGKKRTDAAPPRTVSSILAEEVDGKENASARPASSTGRRASGDYSTDRQRNSEHDEARRVQMNAFTDFPEDHHSRRATVPADAEDVERFTAESIDALRSSQRFSKLNHTRAHLDGHLSVGGVLPKAGTTDEQPWRGGFNAPGSKTHGVVESVEQTSWKEENRTQQQSRQMPPREKETAKEIDRNPVKPQNQIPAEIAAARGLADICHVEHHPKSHPDVSQFRGHLGRGFVPTGYRAPPVHDDQHHDSREFDRAEQDRPRDHHSTSHQQQYHQQVQRQDGQQYHQSDSRSAQDSHGGPQDQGGSESQPSAHASIARSVQNSQQRYAREHTAAADAFRAHRGAVLPAGGVFNAGGVSARGRDFLHRDQKESVSPPSSAQRHRGDQVQQDHQSHGRYSRGHELSNGRPHGGQNDEEGYGFGSNDDDDDEANGFYGTAAPGPRVAAPIPTPQREARARAHQGHPAPRMAVGADSNFFADRRGVRNDQVDDHGGRAPQHQQQHRSDVDDFADHAEVSSVASSIASSVVRGQRKAALGRSTFSLADMDGPQPASRLAQPPQRRRW